MTRRPPNGTRMTLAAQEEHADDRANLRAAAPTEETVA